jgi:Ala-tRNA(Pro) deacylase
MKLDELLTSRRIPFERLHHRPAYTARRMAQVLHVRDAEVAKTVLLRTRHGYLITVLPADRQVDLNQVRHYLDDDWVDLASEAEMDRVFPDCERGAMPPFGSLYHLSTLVDESLAQDEEIVFEAQTHEEAIRMAYRDFEALEHPHKGRFAGQGVGRS